MSPQQQPWTRFGTVFTITSIMKTSNLQKLSVAKNEISLKSAKLCRKS